MKIQQIEWSNYRRIPDGCLEVRQHLVLVGPNDSGKSSIVRALHICLGMAHTQAAAAISARDFTDEAQPLTISVTLDGIEHEDRAAFPDEISTGPPEILVVSLEATVDPTDPEHKVVKRFFPHSGHNRGPSKDQLAAIGFQHVPAARSLLRELGGGQAGAIRSLLSGLDLTADAAAFQAAADEYRTALDGSTALGTFRRDLADALSAALPLEIDEAAVRVVSDVEVLDDPLAGVGVTIAEDGRDVPLAEQSDGIRALSVLTLLSMSHQTAKIVALDEPETHLHPTAQRSVARMLRTGPGQRVIVTHAAAVVREAGPLDVVAVRADRQMHQLPVHAPIATFDATVRHWSHDLIEPLTARRVVLVEGVSDRILVERVAELTGRDLHRSGAAIFDIGGSGMFSVAYPFFGPAGFNVPLVGLLDEDARVKWADELGVLPGDLEAAYIDHLGADVVLQMLLASPIVKKQSLLDVCGVGDVGDITRDQLWNYCRGSAKKVACATAVVASLDANQAAAITPLVDLLVLATA